MENRSAKGFDRTEISSGPKLNIRAMTTAQKEALDDKKHQIQDLVKRGYRLRAPLKTK